MTKKELIRKYVGIPYKHLGRTLDGLDCWGLPLHIYKDMGYQLIDVNNYQEKWSYTGGNYFIENYHEGWAKVTKPKYLDIILFKNKLKIAAHAGVYLGDNKFIHAHRNTGVVISRLQDMWENRVVGFYHLRIRDD